MSALDLNLIQPNNVCIFGFGQEFQNGERQVNGPHSPFLLYYLLNRKNKGHEAPYCSWRSRGMISISCSLRKRVKNIKNVDNCN